MPLFLLLAEQEKKNQTSARYTGHSLAPKVEVNIPALSYLVELTKNQASDHVVT